MNNIDEEVIIFGVNIVDLYEYKLNKKYDLIKNNTNYLENISISEIKDIQFSWYKDIIILLTNGVLLFNGQERSKDIKILWFSSATSIFAISNDNIIIGLTRNDNNLKFINNNNYKYKKIVSTPLIIVALTYEKEVKVFGTIVDNVIDYNNYLDVEDIGYVEEYDDIIIVKNNIVYSLFLENDYLNIKPNIIFTGEVKNVIIL